MNTYVANVVDTAGKWHTVRIQSASWKGVKAQARREVKTQGFDVKFVNDICLVSA
jgi:hypothetical protein